VNKRNILAVIAIMLIGATLAGFAIADDKKPSMEDMMGAYAKYMNPGPQHKLLEPVIGSWDCVSRMWMNPDSLPAESKSTGESRWILGGRFIQEDASGDMMGMPFHGMGLTGYDQINQEYISIWVDEMSTSMMVSRGQMDASGKVLTMYATCKDPMDGMKEKTYKMVTTIISNDKHTMEMYEPGLNGKEKKSFDLTYTRKK